MSENFWVTLACLIAYLTALGVAVAAAVVYT
jgi:hypothetical protein